ncbi:hypothetical protein B0T21DRAFT_429956 [Apiosordaria backusii]|uniref:Uncharacterized protein n=1 Tax=Apiosordaria backusii TaxID=314023 RepID=A0AA40ESW7_9PEZI|nr:hypothetical protein B0T21DRAFT_429956 [Apiosordaria backusii]
MWVSSWLIDGSRPLPRGEAAGFQLEPPTGPPAHKPVPGLWHTPERSPHGVAGCQCWSDYTPGHRKLRMLEQSTSEESDNIWGYVKNQLRFLETDFKRSIQRWDRWQTTGFDRGVASDEARRREGVRRRMGL